MTEASNSEMETMTKPQLIYRCKKCRRIVASEESIVSHERGKGESSFKWKKRSSEAWEVEKQSIDCTSIFVEPMKWMEAGNFNWAALINSCSFVLHFAAVALCTRRSTSSNCDHEVLLLSSLFNLASEFCFLNQSPDMC
ncbi:unnamed protein product [Sphenostylis stenocarpa]|uniref:Uncharacterized protein n=1 Tax=Sphenostylis stenocarpa TaxID=92480 RepID=A0AA86RTE4_9FABA|nr:unnamed protein product [Sphenostylis stenocarpa]